MTKEQRWMHRRCGTITASELGSLFSASGKVTNEMIDYVRRKRFERKHGFSYPVSARNFDIGHEQEKYGCAWWRQNHQDKPVIYSQELPEIPIWRDELANFGASPDAFSPDETYALEIKTLVGNTSTEYYADEYTSYEDKRASVKKEHGMQIAGQFLSNPMLECIYLLKYIYQRDEVDDDTESPLAPWRGLVFTFTRDDFDLCAIQKRIYQFDSFIDSDIETKRLKEYLEQDA